MSKPKDLTEISKADFEAYEKVRQMGVLNMLSPGVQELADIDKETHLGIIKHYAKLMEKWPDVRKRKGV